MTQTPHQRRTLAFLALALLATGLALWYAAQFHWNSADDAYMFLRYARHWLQGHGPTYNLERHVEGYTSFGWMALSTALMGLGVAGPLALKLLAGVSGLLTLLLLWRWGEGLDDEADSARGWTGVLAAGLAALNGSFNFWHLTGAMAVIGAAAALTGAWLLLYSRRRTDYTPSRLAALGALFALAVLLRPECALFAALAGLYLLLGPAGRWRRLLWFALPLVVIVGGHQTFRLLFYGEWLPNTFYAKTGLDARLLSRGLGELGNFLAVNAPLVLGALLVDWRERWRRLWPLPVGLVLYWLYLVTVGGDWMVFRLHLPVLPILALLAALGYRRALAKLKRPLGRRLILIVLAAAVFVPTFLFAEPRIVRSDRRHYSVHLHNTADYLDDHAAPAALIALTSSGAIPFFTDRPIVDLVGIADHHIAHDGVSLAGVGLPGHERYDNDYALAREPDWFVLNPYPAEVKLGIRPRLIHEADLLRRPAFWRDYHFVEPADTLTISLFHRRDDRAGLALLDEEDWRPWWDFIGPLVDEPPPLPPPPR